jgi:hypothetical protein
MQRLCPEPRGESQLAVTSGIRCWKHVREINGLCQAGAYWIGEATEYENSESCIREICKRYYEYLEIGHQVFLKFGDTARGPYHYRVPAATNSYFAEQR